MYLYPILLSLLGLVLLVLVWIRANPHVRVPLAVYLGGYIITTMIGASDIALEGPYRLVELNFGADPTILPDLGSTTYWGVLYGPLIVPPLVLLLLARQKQMPMAEPPQKCTSASIVTPVSFSITFAAFTAFCVYKLAVGGFLGNLSAWSDLREDYMSLILLRYRMVTLGSVFAGLVYIGVPTLSFCAMYQFVTQRTPTWLVIFLGTMGVNFLLCVLVMYKGMLLIYLLFLGIGLSELKAIRWASVGLTLGLILFVLTILQSFFTANWTMADSAKLVIYRMASSYPYYLSLYPDVIPHCGIDCGLHLIGLAEPKTDPVDVWSYMYPRDRWVQGMTPAAAHVRAYAEAGVLYSLAMMVMIGGIIHAVSQLRSKLAGPIAFALYLACLVLLYYVTQTSLRDAVVSCYGVFWAGAVLLALQTVSAVNVLVDERELLPDSVVPRAE